MTRSMTSRRNKHGGGLHMNMEVGEFLDVHHGGEVLRIYFNGKNGDKKYQVTIVAEQSFQVKHSRLVEPPKAEVGNEA